MSKLQLHKWTEGQRPVILKKILTLRQNRMYADSLIMDLQATLQREYEALDSKTRKNLQKSITEHTDTRNENHERYLNLVQTYEKIYKRKIQNHL